MGDWKKKRFVVIETPFRGEGYRGLEDSKRYTNLCMRDCFLRGEVPFASHALYTLPGVLDDKNPEERRMGMDAGFKIGMMADTRVVYTDRGISEGMNEGIEMAREAGQTIEHRTLPDYEKLFPEK